MNLPLQTTPEADAQILEIDHWWRSHRPSAPALFIEELTASFGIIGHAPNSGRLYRHSPIRGTRRVLLKGTRYHVYYVPRSDGVTILAVWHARRGVGPPLRTA